MDVMDKPDVDAIEGLSPCIAIGQATTTTGSRSTVGTMTEINDYLRVLFARAGVPYCAEHDVPLQKSGVHDMVDAVLGFEEGTRVLILAPLKIPGAVTFAEVGKQLTKRGGTRSAEELLELVGLDPKRTLESYPHELSGGQRQRVLIAMALTRDPKLVICDEPTTALDVTVQKQVLKLLNDLQAKLGFAMIFVSHDLALVAEVAHNITVMYAGQVIEQAPTKELLTNPIHEYTRGLLGSVLSIESGSGRLHQVPGAVPSPRDFPKGDRFAPRSSHPRIGLDTRPVFKRVPGTEHFYSELPDEVLKANGLTPHAEVM